MKKVCSVFLAAMLLLSASVGALAVEIPIEGDFVIATEDESCYTIVDNVITFWMEPKSPCPAMGAITCLWSQTARR